MASTELQPFALLTETDVAELLNCSVQQLRRWRKLGTGPAYRKLANCAIRYCLHDVETFVDASLTRRTGWRPKKEAA
jgi:hypothetical protein